MLTSSSIARSRLHQPRGFSPFLKQHPDACLQAAQQLSNDCQSAYDVIRSIGLSHSVSDKLARLLLQWATDGHAVDGTIRLKLALTHEEMAQLIASSRETVTRTLGEFKSAFWSHMVRR